MRHIDGACDYGNEKEVCIVLGTGVRACAAVPISTVVRVAGEPHVCASGTEHILMETAETIIDMTPIWRLLTCPPSKLS